MPQPLTHELAEGQRVIDAQNKNSRIVQVGTQQRSMPHLLKAHEIVKSGQLGEIYQDINRGRGGGAGARTLLDGDAEDRQGAPHAKSD